MSLMYGRDWNVKVVNLPPSVKGLVKRTGDYYTFLVNARHTREQNIKTTEHEEKHLKKNDYEKDNADAVEAEAHRGR